MHFNYKYKPDIVKEIYYITHKAKSEGFSSNKDRHGSTLHEIIYVDYGTIKLDIDGKQFKLSTGECIFIPGGTKHTFHSPENAPFDFLNIMFWGNVPSGIFCGKQTISRRCLDLMERLKEESIHEFPYNKEILYSYLLEFVILFYRNSLEATEHKAVIKTAYQRHYQSEIVNSVLNLINQEFSNPLSLEKASKAVYISKSHLCSLLKKETGKSFSTLLCEKRIDVAKHLLRESSYSLGDVASLVGYKSLSFFFKVFKRYAGMTPKAYARSLGDPERRD
jgi:AraC-like DNA-binding protein